MPNLGFEQLRSLWQPKDSQQIISKEMANPRSIAQSRFQRRPKNSQRKAAGRLAPLKNNSALRGPVYSRYLRWPIRSSARMKTLKTLRSGHGYSTYSRRPIMSSVQMEIVKALCSGERSRASGLLSEMGQKNCSLSASDFLPILEHCARQPDPLFIKETERMMRDKGVNMDPKCYSLIIRALCRGGLIEEAFKEITILRESQDFHPTLPLFNDLLEGCAHSQSHRVSECLDLMEDQMVGKNEITYTQLLEFAVSQGNLFLVHEIWKECTKYYSPNIVSLRKFIWSFSWLGDLEAAYDILQEMVSLAWRGGFFVSKKAGGRLFISRFDVPMPSSCKLDLKKFVLNTKADSENPTFMVGENLGTCTTKNKHGSVICPGRNDLGGSGLTMLRSNHNWSVGLVLQWSFNILIRGCARKSNCRLAEQLIVLMQDLGLEPSAATYDGFVKVVVAEKGYCSGLKVLEIMQQKKLKPQDSTLAIISMGCSRALELDLAETLLHQISKHPDVRPYNSFLKACDTLDQPERAVRALYKMKEMRLQPNIRTYELLFSLFGNYNAPYEEGDTLSQTDVYKRINAIEDSMVENNIQHSPTSMQNLLGALGAEGMVSKLIQYLRMAENQLSRGYSCLRTSTYNVVLHSLVKAEECHMAIEIFKSMKSNGFPPDAATYEIMMNCCTVIRCSKSACALVSMMVRVGFFAQAVTYTSLIKVDRDIDEALEFLEQGNIEGIKPDVVLYNTVLDEACKKGRIDVIELVINQMFQNEVQPDPSTCFLVFSAYVDQDYMNTAMEALQVLSMLMISQEHSILEEKKMEFEEKYILAEDAEAESRMLELFKDCKEHLVVALLNLRWCATLGFQISWLPNQSLWAKKLSSNYGRLGVA